MPQQAEQPHKSPDTCRICQKSDRWQIIRRRRHIPAIRLGLRSDVVSRIVTPAPSKLEHRAEAATASYKATVLGAFFLESFCFEILGVSSGVTAVGDGVSNLQVFPLIPL